MNRRRWRDSDQVSAQAEAADFVDQLSAAIDELAPKQAMCIRMLYGLGQSEALSLKEVAKVLTTPEAEVQRIVREALSQIRLNESLLTYGDYDHWTDEDWGPPRKT